MGDKKIVVHFTVLTFCIAYLISGTLIILGKAGYRVYSWVDTPLQFCMNIPFAVYILSPAIASYIDHLDSMAYTAFFHTRDES